MNNFFSNSKIFAFCLLSFCLGIYLAENVVANYKVTAILFYIILILIALALIWKKRIIVSLVVFCIALVMGIVYYSSFSSRNVANYLPFGKNLTIIGMIYEKPDIRDTETKVKVIVNSSSEQSTLGQKILITLPRYPEYQYGDEISFSGNLEKPGKIQDFDYDNYLKKDLIFSIITKPQDMKLISRGNGNWFYKTIYTIRDSFEKSLKQVLPEPLSALMLGLLLGIRQSIPDSLMNAFNIIGVTHIIAISGYNVTIIVKTFEGLTRHWSRRLSFYLGILGIFVFLILTGASASVLRASIMASMFLLAPQIGRKANVSIAVVFVGFVMILFNPFLIRYDIGFQLSFLAVIGLVFLTPIFDRILSKIPSVIREPLSATLSAQLLTIPIILSNFQRLSIIAPLANILILPIIPVTMFLGFIAGIFSIVSVNTGYILAWPAWVCLKYVVVISQQLAKIPWAAVTLKSNQFLPILYYILLYIIVRMVYKRYDRKKTN